MRCVNIDRQVLNNFIETLPTDEKRNDRKRRIKVGKLTARRVYRFEPLDMESTCEKGQGPRVTDKGGDPLASRPSEHDDDEPPRIGQC